MWVRLLILVAACIARLHAADFELVDQTVTTNLKVNATTVIVRNVNFEGSGSFLIDMETICKSVGGGIPKSVLVEFCTFQPGREVWFFGDFSYSCATANVTFQHNVLKNSNLAFQGLRFGQDSSISIQNVTITLTSPVMWPHSRTILGFTDLNVFEHWGQYAVLIDVLVLTNGAEMSIFDSNFSSVASSPTVRAVAVLIVGPLYVQSGSSWLIERSALVGEHGTVGGYWSVALFFVAASIRIESGTVHLRNNSLIARASVPSSIFFESCQYLLLKAESDFDISSNAIRAINGHSSSYCLAFVMTNVNISDASVLRVRHNTITSEVDGNYSVGIYHYAHTLGISNHSTYGFLDNTMQSTNSVVSTGDGVSRFGSAWSFEFAWTATEVTDNSAILIGWNDVTTRCNHIAATCTAWSLQFYVSPFTFLQQSSLSLRSNIIRTMANDPVSLQITPASAFTFSDGSIFEIVSTSFLLDNDGSSATTGRLYIQESILSMEGGSSWYMSGNTYSLDAETIVFFVLGDMNFIGSPVVVSHSTFTTTSQVGTFIAQNYGGSSVSITNWTTRCVTAYDLPVNTPDWYATSLTDSGGWGVIPCAVCQAALDCSLEANARAVTVVGSPPNCQCDCGTADCSWAEWARQLYSRLDDNFGPITIEPTTIVTTTTATTTTTTTEAASTTVTTTAETPEETTTTAATTPESTTTDVAQTTTDSPETETTPQTNTTTTTTTTTEAPQETTTTEAPQETTTTEVPQETTTTESPQTTTEVPPTTTTTTTTTTTKPSTSTTTTTEAPTTTTLPPTTTEPGTTLPPKSLTPPQTIEVVRLPAASVHCCVGDE